MAQTLDFWYYVSVENKYQKTVLVTGGAGFIGSNLIGALLKKKTNKVVSLDNYSTGKRENHIIGAKYIKGDTRNIEKLILIKPDVVFHLGEYSRVEKSFYDIKTVWESNKDGTFAVLEFCRKRNIKIIYAGSSTKFANGGLGRDQSPYAWTKASNTELVRNYGQWFDLPYAVTYFYNVYGSREISTGPYATVIGIFKEQFKSGKALTIVSPGTQMRNFTYVDDIVSGLILVGEKGSGDNYGLGSIKSFSILDIAHMFDAKIKMLPERKGNRTDSFIDTNRSEKELGWCAKKNIPDYIKEFVDSVKQNLS